jgi:curli production assembly/transport component CsgG
MFEFRATTILLLLGFAAGCSASIQPFSSSDPLVGYVSATHRELISLPLPRAQVVVAVYKFRDQTGQYKPGTDTTGWSTAVTQGATSMLIKALEDAGNGKWVKVLERESLTNLLNERKIIRQTRKQYLSEEERNRVRPLNPLLYAPIMFEGGVVAYETNLLTGGAGARYFGLGASTQYRRDTVTIYLRAVSVKTGEVLKSVVTSKTIFSFEMQTGIFRFLSFKRLLEAEAGFSTNEPPQMAVLQAIEKAVFAMVNEGALRGLWAFEDETAGRRILQSYVDENPDRQRPKHRNRGVLKWASGVQLVH